MNEIVISGTGVFTPKESITNKELVEAYNSYAENFNNQNKDLINKGDLEALELSNEDFIFLLIKTFVSPLFLLSE